MALMNVFHRAERVTHQPAESCWRKSLSVTQQYNYGSGSELIRSLCVPASVYLIAANLLIQVKCTGSYWRVTDRPTGHPIQLLNIKQFVMFNEVNTVVILPERIIVITE